MDMIVNILLLIVGIGVVLWGADKFTDGACGIARKWKVSELVIGLTIVALGTSLPEFMVSFFSVIQGKANMSAGNIIGSNIFNTLVIIGCSAMTMNIIVDKNLLKRDIPLSLVFSLLLFGLTFFDGEIDRVDGMILFAGFLGFSYYTYRLAMTQRDSMEVQEQTLPMWKLCGLLLIGGAGLVAGGQLMVDNGAALARQWNVPESIIGLTILAGGTSLPELATSMMAARKGSDGLALGNAIGSNIFNIAFVLGICSSIMPMEVNDICVADWITLIFSNIVLWIVAITGRRLSRVEGFILILCYLLYLTYRILN